MDQYLTTRSANELSGPRPFLLAFPALSAVACYLIFILSMPGLARVFVAATAGAGGLIGAISLAHRFIFRNRAMAIMRRLPDGRKLLEEGDRLNELKEKVESAIIDTREEQETMCSFAATLAATNADSHVHSMIEGQMELAKILRAGIERNSRDLRQRQQKLLGEICRLHGLSLPETTTKKASA